MKKLLSLLLAITMIATMIPAVAMSAVAQTEGVTHVDVGSESTYTDTSVTPNITYTVIRSASDFLNYDGATNIILADNIDLTEESATTTTTITKAITLANGVIIDGNGYSITDFEMQGDAAATEFSLFDVADNATVTIRNITFGSSGENGAIDYEFKSSTTTYVQGGFLFAKVTCNATIENVTIYANMTTEKVATGMIAGEYAGTLNLTDVKLYGSLTGVNSGNSAQGAFLGRLLNGGDAAFNDCVNRANVSATNGPKVAGFIGQTYLNGKITFTNCENYGTVNANGQQHAGGFVGQWSLAGAASSFTSCVNYGIINAHQNAGGYIGSIVTAVAFSDCDNRGDVTSTASNVGGFVGSMNVDAPLSIQDCFNYGTIKGVTDVGGFAGNIQAAQTSLARSLNYGSIQSTKVNESARAGGLIGAVNVSNSTKTGKGISIDTCANFGTVSGTTTGQYVGGLIGYFWAAKQEVCIENSVNTGDISGKYVGGLIGGTQSNGGNVNITSCLNTGYIESSLEAGGLIAYKNNGVYSLEKCANFGTVKGNKAGGFFGVSGSNGSITINNSLNAGYIRGNASGYCGAFFSSIPSITVNTGTNGNKYVVVAAQDIMTCATEKLDSLANAITEYNTNLKTEAWGKVIAKGETDSEGAVLATPTYAGVQNTAVENGTYKIRLVAAIDTANYSKVGYKVEVNGVSSDPYYVKTIYTGINGTTDGKLTEYSADKLGGTYVYALTIKDLSATQKYTFKITPVAVETDGETTHEGNTYTITYINGVYSGCVVG